MSENLNDSPSINAAVQAAEAKSETQELTTENAHEIGDAKPADETAQDATSTGNAPPADDHTETSQTEG